jgi:hypothetical protein
MNAALNFTPTCRCGKAKDKSKQWCAACFILLSDKDRESFIRSVSAIRRKITGLQVKINATLQVEDNELIDLRESSMPAIREY